MLYRSQNNDYLRGFRDGIPIALGYLAVGFSLGFAAKKAGLNAFQGFLASLFTYASAGEYAAFSVIASSAPYIEMVLVILVANCRYTLMSCAMTQRVSPDLSMPARFAMGGVITDEIFGVSIGQKGYIPPAYTLGAASCAIPSWALGTMLGVIMGNVLPPVISGALGVALYGMFIACFVPEARANLKVCASVLVSFALSFAFSRLEPFSSLSGGMRIIILTIAIASAFAALFPVKEDENA